MKNYNLLLFLSLLLIGLYACTEDEIHSPIGDYGAAPAPIEEASVKNLPGAARITYSLPDDKDLLYVKAEFETIKGEVREAKASYYSNSLLLEGFGDTGDYEVKLYAVDRGENASEPVTVTVSPLTPPVKSVFESLKMVPDFGGVNVAFKNEAQANMAIIIIAEDSLGEFVTADTWYTKSEEGNFSLRGMQAEKRNFGVLVRDRWSNYSDTLFKELTPIYEEKLDKTKFEIVKLPTDEDYAWGRTMDRLWDDEVADNQSIFHTAQGSGIPQWFTFDLGVKAKLSRFTLWQRQNDDLYYTHGQPREWELWGSNDPNPDGSWDESWVKLGHFESIKPSGAPAGQYTNEDKEYAMRGEEFTFPLDAPPVRYIRFKVLRNWSDTDFVMFAELSFWGQVTE